MPLLSIIIPVYNVEKYIDACLKSILNQTFEDYEIILVDDASTDKSGEICDAYGVKHKHIKVIHLEKNSLLGAARNIGVQHASGEYIHFCDSDDYYVEESLSRIADSLNTLTPTVLMGQFICTPEKGAYVCNDIPLDLKVFLCNDPSYIREYIGSIKNLLGTAWRVIVKREFLLKHHLTFLQGYYAEDEEWFPKVICSAESFALLSEPFYCYRPRVSGSITSRKTYLHSKSQLVASLSLLDFLTENNYKDFRRHYIFSRIKFLLGLFATRCDTFSRAQISELACLIDGKINAFNVLQEISQKNDLFDFVKIYGSYMGICLYRTYIIESTVEKVKGKENSEIYIFPTGYSGEATARILQDAGYDIKGFLDNSDIKHGCCIDGLKICPPGILNDFSPEVLNKVFIVVSIQNEKASQAISEQLRNYGIKDSQFSSRIY